MNEQLYRQELQSLVNDAARTLDAQALLEGLHSLFASILALAQRHSRATPEETVEIARHRLDELFTFYMNFYAERARPN